MDKQQIRVVITMLETIAEKPKLWVNSQGSPVDNFLQGIRSICATMDLYNNDEFIEIYVKILAERGIYSDANVYSNIEKKLKDTQMANIEMILIEIDTLKRMIDSNSEEL